MPRTESADIRHTAVTDHRIVREPRAGQPREQEGSALVLRAHESWGRAASARIELPRWGVAFDTAFGPSELKTFRIEPDGTLRETDLLEGLEAEPG